MKTLPLDAALRARLRELFEIDHSCPSGLRWKTARRGTRAGSPAGSLNSRGYWQVSLGGRLYVAHRLIWALTHDEDPGDRQIDHIDRNRGNNDPANLRLATSGENRCNGRLLCANTSGHKGVYRQSRHASWRGLVRINGKVTTKNFSDSKHGGREAALAAAAEWARATREKLHGDFARHE